MTEEHIPVMVEEVLFYLNCRETGIYVDATLGDGGHAAAICSLLGPSGHLIGLDWDDAALERAAKRLEKFKGKFPLLQRSYTELEAILSAVSYTHLDVYKRQDYET